MLLAYLCVNFFLVVFRYIYNLKNIDFTHAKCCY